MLDVIEQIGAFAGLAAFLGLAVLSLLYFAQARDVRRLRDWAGSAPERDAERKEATSAAAAQRAEELRRLEETRNAERRALEEREERRRRREAGLPEQPPAAAAGGGRLSRLGERLAEPRYLVVLFVLVLALVGGGAYMVFGGGDDGRAQSGGQAKSKGNAKRNKAPAQVPASEIQVAVLNGTAVSGLAATFGDMVESAGFSLGAVGNTTESFSRSVVMFERGHAPEAKRVAAALEIPKVELMEAAVQRVAEGAEVAVIAGEDNASAAS